MGMTLRILALLSLLSLLGGCRKEKDVDPPRVAILLPGNGMSLQVPDTLLVQVEVSDEREVKSLSISLLDQNGVPVAKPITVAVNSESAVITRELAITNERLPSGTYTLSAVASDGENRSSAFRNIQVQAAPLRLRALFIAAPTGSTGTTSITRIDSAGALSEYLTLSEFGGAAIDPTRLYLAGTFTQALVGIPQTDGVNPITVPNQGPAGTSAPFFRGLKVDPADGRFYFGTNDGFIRGLRDNGSVAFVGQSPVGSHSVTTAVVGDRLVSIVRFVALSEFRQVNHAYSSGVVLNQFPVDLEPVFLLARAPQQMLIFGNRNGNGVVQERNVVQGGSFDLRVFSEGPISAVVALDESTAIVAIPGRLVRYSALANSIVVLAQGFTAQALAYENATGALYVGVGNTLFTVDPQTGAQGTTATLPHEVGSILPLLNR